MAIVQRTLTATAAAATVFLALALPVGAQSPAPASAPAAESGMHPVHNHAHHHRKHDAQARRQHMQQKVEQLKAALQLTQAQQADWARYEGALESTRPTRAPMERADWAKLTTPERIDRMRELRAERNARAERRAEATKAFYATLTPEQQKTFDAQTLRHGGHAMGFHGRHQHDRFNAAEKMPAHGMPASGPNSPAR